MTSKDVSLKMEGWFKKGTDYALVEGRVSTPESSPFLVRLNP